MFFLKSVERKSIRNYTGFMKNYFIWAHLLFLYIAQKFFTPEVSVEIVEVYSIITAPLY